MYIVSHEVQVIVTATLLAVTAVLALFCDFLRYRAQRQPIRSGAQEPVLQTAIGAMLVPDSVPVASRGSRLATALKEPKRTLSPGAMAAIERGSKLAEPPRKSVARETPAPALKQAAGR